MGPLAAFILVVSVAYEDRLDYIQGEYDDLPACIIAGYTEATEIKLITRKGARIAWGCMICTADGCTVAASSVDQVKS
jgi:hypothetical protein